MSIEIPGVPKQSPLDKLTRIDELLSTLIETIKEQNNAEINNNILAEIIKLNRYKELEKRRWERFNPTKDDEPIYDWTSALVPPASQVVFTFPVPNGMAFHCDRIQINWEANCTYQIFIDSEWTALLPEVIEDLGDHYAMFRPPKRIFADAVIIATNNSALSITFVPFFGGFLRRTKKPGQYEKEENEIDIQEAE